MFRPILMVSLLFISFFLQAPVAPAQSAPQNANQWALLIGVNDYPGEIQDLRFARDDARAIRDLLISSAGFAEDHIRLLTDDSLGEAKATKQNIFAAIDQYLAPRVQAGHQVIVFLAGHGIVRGLGPEARSYYLPVDVDAQSSLALERSGVELAELARKLAALKAAQFTIFVDACREDPFPGRGLKGNTLTDVMARGLRIVRNPGQPQAQAEAPTSITFYACRVGERAYENPELKHGVFTHYILRGLRELAARPDGRVEAGQLAGYLRDNVRQWVVEQAQRSKFAVEQTPTMVASEVRGPIVIARVSPIAGNAATTNAPGGVILNTSPEGAALSINGQAAGSGPLHKDLPPNQYTVRAELAGFQPAEAKVTVLPGYQQEVTLTLQPLTANASYERGVQFENQQLWPQAIAAYEQALREDANLLAAYERLANVYVKNGRYREAVTLMTTAAQKFPNSAVVLAQRSRALSALAASAEKPETEIIARTAAAPKQEESGKKKKKDEEVEEEKGGKKGGKKKKKDEEVEETAAPQSSSASASTNLVAEAIRAAELALQKDANLVAAQLALGFACLLDEKQRARAQTAFVRASTLAPDDAEAYFGVGMTYRLLGQFLQAVPQLKKAIELRPDYYEAQRELAYCYHTQGDTDQAIRQYQVAASQRSKTKNKEDAASNDLALATLYQRKGEEVGGADGEEYKKASKGYEREARDKDPSLKSAVKKLTIAGVSTRIEKHLPQDVRPFVGASKTEPAVEAKLPGNVKVTLPVKIPGLSPGKKSEKETEKAADKSPIKLPIKIPVKTPEKKSDKPADKKADDKKSSDKAPVRLPVKIPIKKLFVN